MKFETPVTTLLPLVLKGFLLGLTLTFMVGPLLFAVVEASLTRGFRAGFAVAAGMWISDALFIALIIYGVDGFASIAGQPGFRLWAGILGGGLLCLFGLGSVFKKKSGEEISKNETAEKLLDLLDGPEKPGTQPNWTTWGLLGFWLKGFLLNTVNPGTIFFWLGVATGLVIPNQWSGSQSATFFGAMLATLALTDVLKAWAAKSLRRFLTAAHVRQVQRGVGFVLLGIGLFLLLGSF